MKFLQFLVLLAAFCCVCGQDDKDLVLEVEDQGEETERSNREAKQLREPVEQGGWRAVNNRDWHNSNGWVPKEAAPIVSSEDSEKPFPRRRRIRKRKRRPPAHLNSEESEEYLQPRRRIRPQTLEDVSDSWAEIEEESVRRPSNRRRITPVYVAEKQSEESGEIKPPEEAPELEKPEIYEKVRDPFTALEEVEAKARLKKKQETEQNKDQETTTVSYLKTLLKQSEGTLSLSELLQQKNLSLKDLLKGKQQAISVLTLKTTTPPNESVDEDSEELETTQKYKATEAPPVVHKLKVIDRAEVSTENISKDTNRNYEVLNDSFEEELQVHKQETKQPFNNFERKVLTTVKNYEVVTEPTTERRIFVPSHPKYYTSFNYKPDMSKKVAESIMKPATKILGTERIQPARTGTEKIQPTRTTPISSTKRISLSSKYLDFRSKYVSLRPKNKTLPMTSAKLNQLVTKRPVSNETEITTTSLPLKAVKIDLKDLFGISKIVNKTEAKPKEDGPLKMSIDIEMFMKKPTTEKSVTNAHQTFKKDLMKQIKNSENEVADTTDVEMSTKYFEKIKPTSAREEIMEILRDHVSRQNLSRILELRNMTVEELVEQRERGSSQLHLADIFHNQTREPEPPNEPYVGLISGVLPFFDRKPKTISNDAQVKKDSEGANYFTSVIDLKPLELNSGTKPPDLKESSLKAEPVEPPREKYTVTSFPTYKIEMEKIIKHNQPPPFQLSVWKSLYPNLYVGTTENSHQTQELDALKPTNVEDIFQNEIRRIEDIENKISESVNDQLNTNEDEHNYEDDGSFHLPSGVKSAIIASMAIVGISLLVFLTIFMIFKWSHKKKKRLCYSDTLSCSRIKSPILETTPRRTLRTIMSETLGRKKKYRNVYPQSMSDYMWENDKKPFQ